MSQARTRDLLRRMLGRRPMRERLVPLLRHARHPIALRDPEGRVLVESHGEHPAPSEPRAPITVGGEVVGWVCGAGAIAAAAEAVALLLTVEAEKRAVASEALLRYKELSLLYDFAGKLADETGTPAELARRLADEARQAIPAEAYRVLLGADATQLDLAAALGARVEADREARAARHVAARVLATGHAQIVDHLDEDAAWIGPPPVERSHLCAPLRTSKEVLGVLAIASSAPAAFTHAEEKLAAALAAIGGLAIANARATAELRAHRDHLEELVRARTQRLEETLGALETANRELERISAVDGLTGVANRRSFDRLLAEEWSRALRGGYSLALLMIDVDCFKAFNDTYGHQAGDTCLRRVAGALGAALPRAIDSVARYGGEEFTAILPTTDGPGAERVAEKLRQAVAALEIPHSASSAGRVVTVSVGVAARVPEPGLPATRLVEDADRGLYEAKRAGRDRWARAT